MIHGFTQNSRTWGRFADLLAADFEVVLVDAPGHGQSEHDHADLDEAGDLIIEAGGEAHYLGYSMGGRMMLHGALGHNAAVRSLTLIGSTAGLEDESERSDRRHADEALADRLIAEGLDSFLDWWLDLALFSTLSVESAYLEKRRENRPDGLAASLRRCGAGTQQSLWNRLGELMMPTLLVAGSEDSKFSAVGRRMADQIHDAQFTTADGGHAIHSEKPDDVAALVREFVRSVEQ